MDIFDLKPFDKDVVALLVEGVCHGLHGGNTGHTTPAMPPLDGSFPFGACRRRAWLLLRLLACRRARRNTSSKQDKPG
jgi:hypothetical protein